MEYEIKKQKNVHLHLPQVRIPLYLLAKALYLQNFYFIIHKIEYVYYKTEN